MLLPTWLISPLLSLKHLSIAPGQLPSPLLSNLTMPITGLSQTHPQSCTLLAFSQSLSAFIKLMLSQSWINHLPIGYQFFVFNQAIVFIPRQLASLSSSESYHMLMAIVWWWSSLTLRLYHQSSSSLLAVSLSISTFMANVKNYTRHTSIQQHNQQSKFHYKVNSILTYFYSQC
jgi:hypothetical protein